MLPAARPGNLPAVKQPPHDTSPGAKGLVGDSALLVFAIAAAGFVFAAFCRLSLVFDGSYYLLSTLQDAAPMIPHRRWCDWILDLPVLWLTPLFPLPADLGVVHGLARSLPPLFSLAVCLGMCAGKWRGLRVWVAIGILLMPLPGQLPIVSEATPALQLSWVLFVFAWRGCPLAWSPAVAIALAGMLTLHPIASPLCLFAAAICAWFPPANAAARSRWIKPWSMIFAAASIAKLVETLALANSYEREHMLASVWIRELASGLWYTPFPVLIPLLAERTLAVWSAWGPGRRIVPPWLPRGLWAVSFVLGVYYSIDVTGWSSSLNYRKFGAAIAVPVVLMASFHAWRVRRGIDGRPAAPVPLRIPSVYPALLFSLILSVIAVRWCQLCESLMTRLAARPTRAMYFEELPPPERYSALNHWSTTSLSLLLQGTGPAKVFIHDRAIQCSAEGLSICPGVVARCEDKHIKLAWLNQAISKIRAAECADPH